MDELHPFIATALLTRAGGDPARQEFVVRRLDELRAQLQGHGPVNAPTSTTIDGAVFHSFATPNDAAEFCTK